MGSGWETAEDLNDEAMLNCFNTFDVDKDGALNITEFTSLCKTLFKNGQGTPYEVDSQTVVEIFNIFNSKADGLLNKEEFNFSWKNWISKILKPRSALIVVDVQNDFISGSLAISNCPAGHNGEDVVAPINHMLDKIPFTMICYSLDWHPTDHVSFDDNAHLRKIAAESKVQDPNSIKPFDVVVFEAHGKVPKMEQAMWPRHCVQETWGAELHKDLKFHPNGHTIKKGFNPDVDSYSAFFDNKKLGKTNMEELIRKEEVTDLYVCGIATDVCVAFTAFHSQELGFRTILVEDASRGIQEPEIKSTFDKLREGHGCIVKTGEVAAMVQGKDRRPELALKLALECRKAINNPRKN